MTTPPKRVLYCKNSRHSGLTGLVKGGGPSWPVQLAVLFLPDFLLSPWAVSFLSPAEPLAPLSCILGRAQTNRIMQHCAILRDSMMRFSCNFMQVATSLSAPPRSSASPQPCTRFPRHQDIKVGDDATCDYFDSAT